MVSQHFQRFPDDGSGSCLAHICNLGEILPELFGSIPMRDTRTAGHISASVVIPFRLNVPECCKVQMGGSVSKGETEPIDRPLIVFVPLVFFIDENRSGRIDRDWETLKVLGDHKDAKQILDRDGLCTVVTRAMSAFLDDPEQSYTTNKLRAGLVNTKNDPEFVADFARFGGLDQDRTVLDELGYTQDASALGIVSRTSTDKWKVGDTCWVEQAEKGRETIAWFGEIKSLSDDGEKASVFSIEDEAEYDCYVSWLRIDEPEVAEPEVEEVPPVDDEAELTPAD